MRLKKRSHLFRLFYDGGVAVTFLPRGALERIAALVTGGTPNITPYCVCEALSAITLLLLYRCSFVASISGDSRSREHTHREITSMAEGQDTGLAQARRTPRRHRLPNPSRRLHEVGRTQVPCVALSYPTSLDNIKSFRI